MRFFRLILTFTFNACRLTLVWFIYLFSKGSFVRLDLFTLQRVLRACCLIALSSVAFSLPSLDAAAQGLVTLEEDRRIESIAIRLSNPLSDEAQNKILIDRVRVGLGLFPGDTFMRTRAEFAIASLQRSLPISKSRIETEPGSAGGLALTIDVTLAEARVAQSGRGALVTGKKDDLPILYDKDGSFVRLKLETIAMAYGNQNAWYGQPGPLLSGNPLVSGKPAGRSATAWGEGFTHVGLYGITPLGEALSFYGGVSGIYSASAGRELFTNRTRDFLGVEDVYIGFVGGVTTDQGDRLVWNVSAGRQRFSVSDGFLIANTASNGGQRAALQSNPRWSADQLLLMQVRYNNLKADIFYLDPDELHEVESHTKLAGVNVDARVMPSLNVGGMFLKAVKSQFHYYTTSDVFSRESLRVYNARFRWQPFPASAGPFVAGEAALQRHDHIAMRARAWTSEVGYSFANDWPWQPTLSYRYASFSGDDPATKQFERWDPLLSGDNGERWVQGINHFKIFQDSNLVTHRFQMRLRPLPKFELVPQFWVFRADQLQNLGGNPAFSSLENRQLGTEANLTAKWFISPKLMLQGHVAVTFPGSAIKKALGGSADPWMSTMVFLRAAL